MTPGEQQEAYLGDLITLTNRYKSEFNLTVAGAMGCLEMMKLQLWKELVIDQAEEDDDKEDDET